METNGHTPGFRWEYLIRPDKTATPQLEELCLGLAKCIIDNEPGVGAELTPQRLAAFYRRVGGNYDGLFLKSGDHGLSFTYRTFGCYHNLQPSHNPFEMPSIPCLTLNGFARWQTLQLLLSPDESVKFLQKSVELYRIPRKDGGCFPGPIPRSCFPQEADEEMEKWYTTVSGTLNQDNYMRRLKASPYQSPHTDDRIDGYFHNGHAPGLLLPGAAAAYPTLCRPCLSQHPVTGLRIGIVRTGKVEKHEVTQTNGLSNTPVKGRTPPPRLTKARGNHHNVIFGHPHSSGLLHIDIEYPMVDPRTLGTLRPAMPVLIRRTATTNHDRRGEMNRLTSKELVMASIEAAPPRPPVPVPLRPEYYHRKPTLSQVPYGSALPVYPAPPQRPQNGQNGVRFRDHIFDNTNRPPPITTTAPTPPARYPDPRSTHHDPRSPMHHPDPSMQVANRDSSSGSDRRHPSDFDRAQRKAGFPSRVHTVSGVGGRQYPEPPARMCTRLRLVPEAARRR
ncbi:uncharacterized protein AB675_8621 [Cyphellophora attinorum]|uniref:DUF7514 domain-containing protein n=1 Tax=Cyphellophora attinorum TaxID=1664694 RepID=A0A0N1P3Q6_9EURO|nr:uncharacterized protein AB675_8621 [Phialophora attinorum]KPI44465.1 hypothetical protein AB675_8621 [Phialophora attinorum]